MKVYLSRSNAADPAVFSIVKEIIEDLGHEVVTFNGGEYSKKPLIECDVLVVVPSAAMLPALEDNNMVVLEDNCPDIGKGQFEQCRDFAKEHRQSFDTNGISMIDIELAPNKHMLVVQEVNVEDPENPSLYVHNITDVMEQDTNDWKSKYGHLNTDECYYNIGAILGRGPVEPSCDKQGIKTIHATPITTFPMLGAASILGIL